MFSKMSFSWKCSLSNILLLITSVYIIRNCESKIFNGQLCTTGGIANLQGTCKSVSECPAALSNFRAGIHPPLCYMEDSQPFICCPHEKRISEIKCDEYFHQIKNAFSAAAGGTTVRGCFSRKRVWAFNKIVGGRNADLKEMSYMAALGYYNEIKKDVEWKCGGTLISEQFVLTAAHCLTGKKPTHVLLGVKDLHEEVPSRVEAVVDRVYMHPEYNPPVKYNDLGLIKLDRKLTFDQSLYPACLPQPSKSLESINKTLAAGWGRLEYFGNRAETLQVVDLNAYSMKECKAAFGGEYNDDLKSTLPHGFLKSQICAGDTTGIRDTCDGDSGGPLVVRDNITDCTHFVVGITSFGDQFCGSGIPAIYTNVQSYLDWIEDIVWR